MWTKRTIRAGTGVGRPGAEGVRLAAARVLRRRDNGSLLPNPESRETDLRTPTDASFHSHVAARVCAAGYTPDRRR